MRQFYQNYQMQQTVSVKLLWSHYCELLTISAPDKEQLIAQVEAVLNEWHKLEKE